MADYIETRSLERIYHFEYRGKSTDTILDTPLQIVFLNEIGELGTTLEKVEGNATISKPRTNEYGVQATPLSFEMGLVKQNEEPFTTLEARIVEEWLTSPMYSSELKVESCYYIITRAVTDNEEALLIHQKENSCFMGLFLQTRWERGNGGLYLCNTTFQCQDAYPYQTINFEYNNTSNQLNIDLNVKYDIAERYVYPIIRIIPHGNAQNSSFTLTQRTDNGNKIQVNTTVNRPITLDCRHCMVYYCTGELAGYQRVSNVSFKELGWDKIDKVYWPRLMSGQNNMELKGDVDIIIEAQIPIKKVGGWLL